MTIETSAIGRKILEGKATADIKAAMKQLTFDEFFGVMQEHAEAMEASMRREIACARMDGGNRLANAVIEDQEDQWEHWQGYLEALARLTEARR